MRTVCTVLLLLTVAPAFAGQRVATTCSASQTGTIATLTDTITAAPSWAPAGYRAHFEWLGPLRMRVKYGDEISNSESVVTVDTLHLAPGTYKAIGKLMLMNKDQVLGWGKCITSITVK
jgi:hypothetical protein